MALSCSRAVHSPFRVQWVVLALILAALPCAAKAGSFDIGEVHADYKLTLNYGVAMRTKDPDQALINGPIDPLFVHPADISKGTGFGGTDLPTTVNADDADRNFRKFSLINNRVSGLLETQFTYDNYGIILSGDGFYDQVYHHPNDNDSPGTVNKYGQHNRFTDAARYYDGQRVRLLDAYAYGTWSLRDDLRLDLRAGQQLVAWGDSLFFSGMALAQSAADGTKAFTPGAEVKDILLPGNQISASLAIGPQWTLMSYYKLAFKKTEIFPVGDYFSSQDIFGPGGVFAYGALNPLNLNGCPGLLGALSFLCNLGGVGGVVLDAPPVINIQRGPDQKPSNFGQYGIGGKYQISDTTNIGLYYLRYTDSNPSPGYAGGYPVIGYLPVTHTPITTQILNEPTTDSVFETWFTGIDMYAASFSTLLGPVNVAGEVSYRKGLAIPVQTIQLGLVTPDFSRGDLGQVLTSAIYATNPHLWFDNVSLVGEVGYVHEYHVDPVHDSLGVVQVGNGDSLFYDKNSWAFQTLMVPGRSNVINGWDLSVPIALGMLVKGNPSMPGAFGAFSGAGDLRLSAGLSMQYFQNLQFSFAYNFFFGNPDQNIGQSFVKQNAFADRDYVTLSIKYQL